MGDASDDVQYLLEVDQSKEEADGDATSDLLQVVDIENLEDDSIFPETMFSVDNNLY